MISPLMHIALDSESNSQTCIHNLLHRGKLKVMIFQSLKVTFMHCSLAKNKSSLETCPVQWKLKTFLKYMPL